MSIIASMLRNCQGSQRQRLLAKFTENDLEKVDRLLELHFKYMDKVDRTEKEMEVSIDKEFIRLNTTCLTNMITIQSNLLSLYYIINVSISSELSTPVLMFCLIAARIGGIG